MQIFFAIYFFILGALFASFYNVVGIRVLDRRSIMPRSRCPKCNHQLRWIDVIPIFGYLINCGKCHFCKEKIHPKYLFIELLGGMMFMLSYLAFDFSWHFLFACLFASLLMIISVTEYEYNKMLNIVIYISIPVYLVIQLLLGNIVDALLGGALLGIIPYLYHFIEERSRGYLLFFIAIGICLGLIPSLISVLFMGIILGLKKLVKFIRIPNAYLISIISFVCFLYANYWINSLLFFLNR